MNEILKSQDQIEEATKWLVERDLATRPDCIPKDWDMAQIIPFLDHGDILEMGCFSSVAIENCHRLHLCGRKVGIDLREEKNFRGEFIKGDFLEHKFPDWEFDTIICLSVIEHGVDLDKFFDVCRRTLRLNGQLLLTFDYWNPKVDNKGTDTTPFCRADVENMLKIAAYNNLHTTRMSYAQSDPVICWGNHSPHKDLSYTFGSLRLCKV